MPLYQLFIWVPQLVLQVIYAKLQRAHLKRFMSTELRDGGKEMVRR